MDPAGGAVNPAVLAAGGVPPSVTATTQTQLILRQNTQNMQSSPFHASKNRSLSPKNIRTIQIYCVTPSESNTQRNNVTVSEIV